jgi:hypothetical protein
VESIVFALSTKEWPLSIAWRMTVLFAKFDNDF